MGMHYGFVLHCRILVNLRYTVDSQLLAACKLRFRLSWIRPKIRISISLKHVHLHFNGSWNAVAHGIFRPIHTSCNARRECEVRFKKSWHNTHIARQLLHNNHCFLLYLWSRWRSLNLDNLLYVQQPWPLVYHPGNFRNSLNLDEAASVITSSELCLLRWYMSKKGKVLNNLLGQWWAPTFQKN